jgi:hypothetical protein
MRTPPAESGAAAARFATGRADFAGVFVEREVVDLGIGRSAAGSNGTDSRTTRAEPRPNGAGGFACARRNHRADRGSEDAMVSAARDRNVTRRRSTPWWAWLAGSVALAAAIGLGLYVARKAPPPTSALPGQSSALPPAASAPPASTIQHPIGDVANATDANAPVLPALDASDAAAIEALTGFAGTANLGALLNPEHVIQRIVATIDSLPRQKLSPDALPIRGASGAFAVRGEAGHREIDPHNAERYAIYARIADMIDAKALVAWYVRFYPLFQQAYREQGYADGYFNDRLVVVIDHLLETPDLHEPAALTQPNVVYEFADPSLEKRSAGQKLLLRSGPENERAIKSKLREIRAALVGAEVHAAPEPVPTAPEPPSGG